MADARSRTARAQHDPARTILLGGHAVRSLLIAAPKPQQYHCFGRYVGGLLTETFAQGSSPISPCLTIIIIIIDHHASSFLVFTGLATRVLYTAELSARWYGTIRRRYGCTAIDSTRYERSRNESIYRSRSSSICMYVPRDRTSTASRSLKCFEKFGCIQSFLAVRVGGRRSQREHRTRMLRNENPARRETGTIGA